jgi:hypothetical protein
MMIEVTERRLYEVPKILEQAVRDAIASNDEDALAEVLEAIEERQGSLVVEQLDAKIQEPARSLRAPEPKPAAKRRSKR